MSSVEKCCSFLFGEKKNQAILPSSLHRSPHRIQYSAWSPPARSSAAPTAAVSELRPSLFPGSGPWPCSSCRLPGCSAATPSISGSPAVPSRSLPYPKLYLPGLSACQLQPATQLPARLRLPIPSWIHPASRQCWHPSTRSC